MSKRRQNHSEGHVTFDTAGGGQPPRRVHHGLTTAMTLETPGGWRRVETLEPGHRVQTLWGGCTVIRRIERRRYLADVARVWPEGLVLVPGGVLNNCAACHLLPEQLVLLQGPYVRQATHGTRALVAARTLLGFAGVRAALPVDGIDVFRLRFQTEDLAYANTGLLIHCPTQWTARRGPGAAGLPVLSDDMARHVLARRFPADRPPGGHPARPKAVPDAA